MRVLKRRSPRGWRSSTPPGWPKRNKILVICGLTASGKTSLALKIAKKIGNASIISVDSRQAYQGLPILTGQDIPPGFTRHQTNLCKYRKLTGVYFAKDSINIWGVDQVPLTETLNISDFANFAWKVIKKEALRGKKIILVGGTGLYLKAITEPMLNIHLGFNQELRNNLTKLSVEKLQKKLASLSPKKLANLNQSDKLNPRRLIRAIEIIKNPNSKRPAYFNLQKNTTFRWVGLKSSLDTLEKNIHKRVLARLKNKAINEVKQLTKKHPDPNLPIYTSLGLSFIQDYLKLAKGRSEPSAVRSAAKDGSDLSAACSQLISRWVSQELAYAKRQLTWFKKQPAIIWYDQSNNQTKLINILSLWLTKPSATQ